MRSSLIRTEDLQIDVIRQFTGDVRTNTCETCIVNQLCRMNDQRSILFDELVAICASASMVLLHWKRQPGLP